MPNMRIKETQTALDTEQVLEQVIRHAANENVVGKVRLDRRHDFSYESKTAVFVFYGFHLFHLLTQWYYAGQLAKNEKLTYFAAMGYEGTISESSNIGVMSCVLVCDLMMLIPVLLPANRLRALLMPGIVANVIWFAISFRNLLKFYGAFNTENDLPQIISDIFCPAFLNALHFWFIMGAVAYYLEK